MKRSTIILIFVAVFLCATNLFLISSSSNKFNCRSLLTSHFSANSFAYATDAGGAMGAVKKGPRTWKQSCANKAPIPFTLLVSVDKGKVTDLERKTGLDAKVRVPYRLADIGAGTDCKTYIGWEKLNANEKTLLVSGEIDVKEVTEITAKECDWHNAEICEFEEDKDPCNTLLVQRINQLKEMYE